MKKLLTLFIPLIFLIATIYPLALFFENLITAKEVEATIMSIEKSENEEGEIFYFVRTNVELFINANNKFHKKNNADLIVKKLKVGQTYKFEVVGFNFGIKLPFFLKERNIIDIVEEENLIKKFRKY